MDLASAGASCSMVTAVGHGLVSHMVEYAVYKRCTAKVAKGYFFKVRADRRGNVSPRLFVYLKI